MHKQTNGDRIRAIGQMSNAELAELFFKHNLDELVTFCEERPECIRQMEEMNFDSYSIGCKQCFIKWLEQEANQ